MKSLSPGTSLIGKLLIILCAVPSGAFANSFGLTFFDQVDSATSHSLEVQNLAQLSYSDAFSDVDAYGNAGIFSGSIDNGVMHLYSQTATVTYGETYSNADLYFYDTFYIAGPAGQSGQFQLDMTLDGSITKNSTAVGDLIDTYDLYENGTVNPGAEYFGSQGGAGGPGQSGLLTLTLAAGSSVTIGELLQVRNLSLNGGAITIDNSDTAYMTVTPETAGFSFTTASGLDYAEPPATPEPGTFGLALLVALGLAIRAIRKRRLISTLLFSALSLPASTLYTVTLLPGNATAINNNGVIAGNLSNGTLYIDNNGSVSNIGTLGVRSVAYGINDSNEVAGYYYYANGTYRGFVYTGSFSDIGDFGGAQSGATSINDSGYVTGFANDSSSYQAIYYKGPGQLNELPDIGIQAEGQGINAGAEITGAYETGSGNLIAFLYAGGVMHSLGTLGGATSYGFSINDSNVIVGESATAAGYEHGFIDSSGVMTNLGTLGGNSSEADDINDSGIVVGRADLAGGIQHAAIDLGNNQWVDLNTLLLGSSGVTLTQATAINSSGEILAADAAGNTYLLAPTATPEPGTFSLSVAMAAILLLFASRYRVARTEPASADSPR